MEFPRSACDLLAKFQQLHDGRESAIILNLEAAKAEDARLKVNPRVKARLLRKREQAEEYFSKKQAEEDGLDYERIQSLNWTVEEIKKWNERVAEKESRIDVGFTDYNQMAFRKYNRLTSDINPDFIKGLEPDSADAKANLVADLQRQLATRATLSKRRHFNQDENITFINQRNYRFNKKIARAFDKFTEEIKDNLERGTAL